jgi:hypothetical protein
MGLPKFSAREARRLGQLIKQRREAKGWTAVDLVNTFQADLDGGEVTYWDVDAMEKKGQGLMHLTTVAMLIRLKLLDTDIVKEVERARCAGTGSEPKNDTNRNGSGKGGARKKA